MSSSAIYLSIRLAKLYSRDYRDWWVVGNFGWIFLINVLSWAFLNTESTEGEDFAQLLTYMKLAAAPLRFLINFNSPPLNNIIK